MMLRTIGYGFVAATILILGAADVGVAQIEFTCTDEESVGPCNFFEPSIVFSADYLFWQPTSNGGDFAISEVGGPATLNSGQVHRVGLDRDSGFRTNLAYQTKAGWSIGVGFSYFDAFGQATVDRPPGNGQLFATQSHPGGNEEADTSSAEMTFDYAVFDVEIAKPIVNNQSTRVSLFGGIRWAEIDQTRRYRYDGRDFTNGVISRDSQTTGSGIRIGGNSDLLLAGGFRLYGQVSGGILLREINSTLGETDVNDTVTIIDVVDNRDGSLPFINAALGVGWSRDFVSVLVGYELENWFGLEDRSMFVDHIREATYATISEDLLLSGLFVRATFKH